MNKNTDRIRNISVCVVFFTLIIGIFVLGILLPDKEISKNERRKLSKFPELSTQSIFDGKYMTSFEKYALDHFAARDTFRNIKAIVSYKLLQKQDNNNIFVLDGAIYRMEYPLSEKDFTNAANKFNRVYDMYLQGMDCYYSMVPDKNYFVAEQNGYLSIDYDKARQLLMDNVKNMEYIDLFSVLKREDYYKTDTHWRQENLQEVVNALSKGMGFIPADFSSYKINSLSGFKGVYYGQAALNLDSEDMNYLTNEATDGAAAYNFETQKEMPVYDTEKFNDTDPYNLFLAGPSTLLEITNSKATSKKELIIFRDSFGSSIAPMLIESYSKVTLVDLRYIPASTLAQFIEFKGQDVLFLYSTLVLNNSAMLRI